MLTGPANAQAAPRRPMPPEAVACARDQLTLYGGEVLHYRRGLGHTELRIRTDWASTETLRLQHPGTDDPSHWFLIERQRFSAADWPRIESAPGRLRPGLRVAAWVCGDGRNAVLDWQPPRAP